MAKIHTLVPGGPARGGACLKSAGSEQQRSNFWPMAQISIFRARLASAGRAGRQGPIMFKKDRQGETASVKRETERVMKKMVSRNSPNAVLVFT
eukprot:1141639-Pelagomonas_calceolata.AAC.4